MIFRGESGDVYAMDGFCPHIGVDLGIGKVKKDNIQCFFHHWRILKDGKCVDIPCGEKVPGNVSLNTYKVVEKYGLIFVNPNKESSRGCCWV